MSILSFEFGLRIAGAVHRSRRTTRSACRLRLRCGLVGERPELQGRVRLGDHRHGGAVLNEFGLVALTRPPD